VFLTELEAGTLRLYERVRAKYPAQPVAVADNGSCSACFRSLPPQLFNEVLQGEKILQCPGCARILVAALAETAK